MKLHRVHSQKYPPHMETALDVNIIHILYIERERESDVAYYGFDVLLFTPEIVLPFGYSSRCPAPSNGKTKSSKAPKTFSKMKCSKGNLRSRTTESHKSPRLMGRHGLMKGLEDPLLVWSSVFVGLCQAQDFRWVAPNLTPRASGQIHSTQKHVFFHL